MRFREARDGARRARVPKVASAGISRAATADDTDAIGVAAGRGENTRSAAPPS
jgi:hypothetical protein